MNDDVDTVSDLGERGLIERIHARIGAPPPDEVWGGDDAAVVTHETASTLLTIDSLVDGVDFDLAYSTGADVGWKVMAANASDIAAMGGRPRHAVASLTLPPDTSLVVVDGVVDGMMAAAERWPVSLVGGDISGGGEIAVTIAMTGEAERDPVLRRGARAGDALCVTGCLGGSAGGLEALRRGLKGEAIGRLKHRHLRPQARVEEGVVLAGAGATSMIDVSDGLAVDVGNLMRASGMGCDIDPDAVPIDPDLDALAEVLDPRAAAILGGEDFELLFTIGESSIGSLIAGTGIAVTRIGTVTAGERTLGGAPLQRWEEMGWEHLRDR
jgi:thiamine-monophosphate kinase